MLLLCACASIFIMAQEKNQAIQDMQQDEQAVPATVDAQQQSSDTSEDTPQYSSSEKETDSDDSSSEQASSDTSNDETNVQADAAPQKPAEQKQPGQKSDIQRKEEAFEQEGIINVGNLVFEVEKRRKQVVELVNRGVKALKEEALDKAC